MLRERMVSRAGITRGFGSELCTVIAVAGDNDVARMAHKMNKRAVASVGCGTAWRRGQSIVVEIDSLLVTQAA